MRTIVEIKFGSHLYGTATPASDLDLKQVYVPDGRDILLQRVKAAIVHNTKDDRTQKNTADDIDVTTFSIQRFLGLVLEGQVGALDMLFAPSWAFTSEPDFLWGYIVDSRHSLISKRSSAFVGYCRTQANKYGIRGSRVAAARAALGLLQHAVDQGDGADKLDALKLHISALQSTQEHMEIINIPSQAGTDVFHWAVCGRKMPFTASIKSARDIMQRVVDEYGHRALAAEKNQGVDWKALSHAVRVGRQAIELLDTGNMTFPRPEAAHLIAIKTGQLAYALVAEEIDQMLLDVEAAEQRSTLPEHGNQAIADSIVLDAHAEAVRSN
jgi:hypothetical protein